MLRGVPRRQLLSVLECGSLLPPVARRGLPRRFKSHRLLDHESGGKPPHSKIKRAPG